jgi:glycosyltransferase involved in cell wall biosynthesis
MRIVALVAAFNEADVIGQVLDDLIRQGIDVHLIDNASTDGTPGIAAERLGRGVVAVERVPATGDSEDYPWAALLARKAELAATLDADWFLHHDADELRESPWPGVDLRGGIELVDRLGYDAIDFEVLDFRPVNDEFTPGADLRQSFRYFEPAAPWDRVQVKAWKRQAVVDLVSNGGHEAAFPGRRVFPIRFLCRHYPIRSRTHGERKVFGERLPRFRPDELERGWHRQYERLAQEARFVWSERDLTLFDPESVRAELWIHNRVWEEAAGTPTARAAELVERERRAENLSRRLDERNRTVDGLALELDGRNREAIRLSTDLDQRNREVERLGLELDSRNRESVRLATELDERNREAERLGLELDVRDREAARLGKELDQRNREAERLGLDLDLRNREAARLAAELDGRHRELAAARVDLERQQGEAALAASRSALELDRLRAAIARLEAEVEVAREERAAVARELERLLSSRTWRWSAPIRRLFWNVAGSRG